MTVRDPWDSFFEPDVVCVVGASADPTRIGGRLVRYSLESGFTGRIVPVNPNRDAVFGLPTVRSLAGLDVTPDWVLIALPREQVPGVVEQAAAIGARNVAIVAAGFAEVDAVGRELQQAAAAVARKHGIRLLGPNSNGFMNADIGAFFAFTPVIDSARPRAGEVAIVTQSAALGTYLLNRFAMIGLGVRNWIHTGNEADLTVVEVVRMLAEREQVRAVALCFEVLRDLPDLQATLVRLAEHGIAVGVLQAGLSDAGKRASEAHTAALVGAEAAVVGDVLRQAGAYVARSIASLADFIQVAINHRELPPAPRMGLVTTSGGVGVLMADAVEARGLAMPPLSPALQTTIRSYAPYAYPRNPVDTTAQIINDPAAFQRIATDCATSGELDLLAVFIAHGLAGSTDPTLLQLLDVATDLRQAGRSIPALAALGVLTPQAGQRLQSLGVSVFAEPVDLADAIAAHATGRRRREAFGRRAAVESPAGGVVGQLRSLVDGLALDPGFRIVDEIDSKLVLGHCGAEVVPGEVACSSQAAVEAAQRLAFPVAMKVVSPLLAHKVSQGALRIDLWSEEAVREAFGELTRIGAQLSGPRFRILVERQESGEEIFLGCVRHRELGVLLGIGPGGTGVEQTKGVRWLWPPVGPGEVSEAIADRPASAPPSDAHVDGLARTAMAMAWIVAEHPTIHTVEANPVMLTHDGRVVVVDALIELVTSDSEPDPTREEG